MIVSARTAGVDWLLCAIVGQDEKSVISVTSTEKSVKLVDKIFAMYMHVGGYIHICTCMHIYMYKY